MKKKHKQLLDFMAKACSFAQSHIGDPEAWGKNVNSRETYLQCVSFQMACFLARNTVEGAGGVDWCIVIDELTDPKLDKNGMMKKSVKEWKKILLKIVNDLGGWTDKENF